MCFYSEQRLHEGLDGVPPAECEQVNIKTDNTAIVATAYQGL